jgi:hypothetical protein
MAHRVVASMSDSEQMQLEVVLFKTATAGSQNCINLFYNAWSTYEYAVEWSTMLQAER